MDAYTKALQPVSAADFIDEAFKERPEGVVFKEWQPVDGLLESLGRQLEVEDVLNHGGSSQGSQTALHSTQRATLPGGIHAHRHYHMTLCFMRRIGLHRLGCAFMQGNAKPTTAATPLVPPTTCKM